MNTLEFSFLIWLGALTAGFLGALTGLGGGVVIVPLLALIFHVDIHYAIGASLVSVIATSTGSTASFVRDGFTNIRIGMLLEVATTSGAIVGASLAAATSSKSIAILFGAVLIFSAVTSLRTRRIPLHQEMESHPTLLSTLNGTYPLGGKLHPYKVRRVPLGFGLMFGAGALSGLLGIGSGAVKVLVLDEAMSLPFKVSTTTSNFMIGVTAAASAGIYLGRGYIDPAIAMPITLGVLAGSFLGAKCFIRANTRLMRIVFAVVVSLLGCEMMYGGLLKRL